MTKSADSRPIVASCLCLGLVDFFSQPTSDQIQAKQQFNSTLQTCFSELGKNNYWVRDFGEGALIVCPHSPEHALFLALRLQQLRLLGDTKPASLQLRTGLHLGSFRANDDLEGRRNYLGDGIATTQRIMGLAEAGGILASWIPDHSRTPREETTRATECVPTALRFSACCTTSASRLSMPAPMKRQPMPAPMRPP